MEYSDAVNRRTDNTTANKKTTKKTPKKLTMVHKSQYRKIMIAQQLTRMFC
jgi:hypothetical protein